MNASLFPTLFLFGTKAMPRYMPHTDTPIVFYTKAMGF